jgi:hypothetical protein
MTKKGTVITEQPMTVNYMYICTYDQICEREISMYYF